MDACCSVDEINLLHREAVQRWHQQPLDNPYEGFLQIVCQQHQFNFLLWHEEDIARSPQEPDSRIAQVKRAIDRYNQQRNDWIERMDEYLLQQLVDSQRVVADAPLNTETPGSAIDRLSIMSLRIYHLHDRLTDCELDPALRSEVEQRLHRCHQQQTDLSQALSQLLQDIWQGRKQLKLYRQMKLYNDAKMNPYLYQQTNPEA